MKSPKPLFRMLPSFALCAAITAQTWTETDAGELPLTAETAVGVGPLQRIDGNLSTNTDVDMFLIRVDDPTTFRCSTVGGASWDTSLWLFRRDGRGIAFQEDDGLTVQSTLTGQFLGGPGYVLIAISAWDNDPRDAANQELWQDQPWDTERQPDGPGAANPVDHWDQTVGIAAGAYSMFLSGASFVAADPLAALNASTHDPYFGGNFCSVQLRRLAGTSYEVNVFDRSDDPGSLLRCTIMDLDTNTQVFDRTYPPSIGSFTTPGTFAEPLTITAARFSVRLQSREFSGSSVFFGSEGITRTNPPTSQLNDVTRSYSGVATGVAWAWVLPNAASTTIVPDVDYQYTPSGELITVDRLSQGRYAVNVPRLGIIGAVHACACRGNHTAVVRDWGVDPTMRAYIDVLDTNGAPVDQPFCIHYRIGGPDDLRAAYLWADNPTAASYTPHGTYMWNGTRGNATITRLATGHYRVSIPGLGTPVSGEYGNVQVSAQTGFSAPATLRHAKVGSWVSNGSTLDVYVRTFDGAGAPVDSMYVLSYHEKAAPIAGDLGSGAHVWADNPTAASYAPDGLYTDSNGTAGPRNAETITRIGTGVYEVVLPSVVHLGSTHAQVTAYGSGSEYASISHWAVNGSGRTYVRVNTFSGAGAPVDTRFSLSYLTDRPALHAATVATVGQGCHGPVLRAPTRPVQGTNWTLDMTGLPASSVLGFLQLGLTNPNLPLGFAGAPDCVRLQDGLVTNLLILPISHPTFVLPLSTDPAFLGLGLFAQGGSLAPGVNALGLAASNGILGVVGNN